MRDPLEQAQLLVQQAMLALSQHREEDARNLARQAADLAPDQEGVWLVMAAVSTPQAAEVYLRKALQINPNSERARKGLEWVNEQTEMPHAEPPRKPTVSALRRFEASQLTAEIPDAIPAAASVAPEPAPEFKPYPAEAIYPQPPAPKPASFSPAGNVFQKVDPGRLYSRKVVIWPWILAALAVLIGFTIWMAIPPLQSVSASSQHANRQPGEIVKPSITPSPTNTPEPTATPTPTFTPSPTAAPTNTPTRELTATPEELSKENYSDEKFEYVYNLDEVPDVAKDERWIDVDLSSQTLTAYLGDEVVNSFLVSTGTAAHPTVTGKFHIYVKYRYTDMSGPGYYLPDVPYTMYFHDGYGLHGTYWHSNFGVQMSHGCVNLATEDSAWLYDWADIGTLVNVHY